MKQSNHLTLFLLLLIAAFTQCTVQKRLYNRGYHIEHRTKFRSEEPKNPDSVEVHLQANVNDGFISESSPIIHSEGTDHTTDTIVMISKNGTKRDTVYAKVLTDQEARQKRKEARLVGVAIPMVVTGVISAAAFSASNAATVAASIYFFGSIGWIFLIAAIILAAIFIIILTTPINEPEKKKEPRTGLTKGERIGLIISFTVVAIIAAAFWLKGLM